MSYDRFILYMAVTFGIVSFIFCLFLYNREEKITTGDLEDKSVTLSKLANNSVDQHKIMHNYFLNNKMRYFFEFWQKPVVTSLNMIETVSAITGDSPYTQAVDEGGSATYNVSIAWNDIIVPKMETETIDTYRRNFADDYDVTDNLTSVINQNFILVGTNAPTFGGSVHEQRGLLLNTTDAIDDQSIAYSTVGRANSDSQFDFTTVISFPDITDIIAFVGLKRSPDPYAGADDDCCYFFMATNNLLVLNGEGSIQVAEGKLCFAYSTDGDDYVSVLPITVVAEKDYELRITCDEERQLSIFVNDQQFSINRTTEYTYNPIAVNLGKTKSRSLDNNRRFRSVVGVQTLATSEKGFECRYMKCINTW
jgi:hypothetical protein